MRSRQSRAAWAFFGSLTVLAGAALLWILQKPQERAISQAPSRLAVRSEAVHPERSPTIPPSPIPTNPAPAPASATTTADSRPPQPQPFPPATLQMLTTRYHQLLDEQRASKELLQKQIDADPELSDVLKAKLAQLEQPLLFITLSQALDDPVLRQAMVYRWKDAVEHRYPLVDLINEAAARFGVKSQSTGSPKSPVEVAIFFRQLEPHLQTDYQRLLEKLEVSEDVARTFESAKGSGVLSEWLEYYITRSGGYYYQRDTRSFLPRQ